MGAQGLSSRAIIGAFFDRLTSMAAQSWIPLVSMHFLSNQISEVYKFLGMAPAVRPWEGPRMTKGLREDGVTIINELYETSIEVDPREARRDKSGQIMVRVNELASRMLTHWGKLLSDLINNGAAAVGYDGQYFFDTDHVTDLSGTQDNDLSIDISALPTAVHGSTTAPSPEESAACIFQAIAAILGFKDDQGEPMNEDAESFLVMTGANPQYQAAIEAVSAANLSGGRTNSLAANFNVSAVMNARITATEGLYVFRTDGEVKPFIRQSERQDGTGGGEIAAATDSTSDVRLDAVAEGSEMEARENKWLFGASSDRAVGYGYWQHACLVTMT